MKKACYVAGPMTGYKDLNYPAFAHAAQCLRALGFGVVSPAELNPIETAYENAMRNDIHALADCSHIHLLDGWEKSKGANCEWHVAQLLGITRIGIDGEPVTTAATSPSDAAPDILSILDALPEGMDLEERDIGRALGLEDAAEICAEMAREAATKADTFNAQDGGRADTVLYVRYKGMADALREAERRIRAAKEAK